ncbi:MAG: FMN-binding protein [Bacteroidales bacterium]|nr:FMN-binding protein [Bacteroidales bacterium]
MTLKLIIFTLLLFPTFDYSSSDLTFPNNVEKRINKRLDKFFDKDGYNKKTFQPNDSLSLKSNSYFYKVENASHTKKALMVITIANGCRIGGCDVELEEGDEFEQFFLYTLFNEEGELIDIKILDYQSEYGYEVTSKWWLKQFTKKWGQYFEYSKNIDAVSGATVSVKSMIREMNLLQEVMKQ